MFFACNLYAKIISTPNFSIILQFFSVPQINSEKFGRNYFFEICRKKISEISLKNNIYTGNSYANTFWKRNSYEKILSDGEFPTH